MEKPLVIIGGGGHASVLVDVLLRQNRQILAIISPESVQERPVFSGIRHLKDDQDISEFASDEVLLVNGIGVLPGSGVRRKVSEHFLSLGYRFETVIADDAIVSPFALVHEGAQVFSGAVVQTGAVVGTNSIINTNAVIEHDSVVGEYSHIAPNATLCGQVCCQQDVFVGAGATVVQGLTLENQSIVGAGAALTQDLAAGKVCYSERSLIK
ncbi:acetyltransferase [Vibrio sp. SCSIO 43137]|nr:acetyltransferase [Vibrio sp. SCSIO 43137]WCE31183.1 acetyltransferase [Vibrio sp. SCSIO 43137]